MSGLIRKTSIKNEWEDYPDKPCNDGVGGWYDEISCSSVTTSSNVIARLVRAISKGEEL